MGEVIIENETQLKVMLHMFLKENQGHLDVEKEEKRRQRHATKAVRELEADDEEASQVSEQDEESEEGSPKKDSDVAGEVPSAEVARPSEKKVATADVKDIVKTLNVMRSGRSTKDPEVQKALKTYIDGLTTGEQQSLFVFLSGLSQMMVGDASGTEATDPQQVGIKTKATDTDEEENVSVAKKKVTKKKGREGDEETPIVVGEAADKTRELSILRNLRGQ
jgi:hypothetical protein